MKYFVTGTGTDIGKTVVCAWLAMHLQAEYWKPVQCGFPDGRGDRELVHQLSGCTTHAERYRLALPRSPHIAAAAEGVRIDVDGFIAPSTSRLIVEGAGGVLVPLNERELMLDLMVHLGFPAIVVASGALGGINHVLLTLEALQCRNHPIFGVIFTGPVLPETVAAVSTYGKSTVLAHLPYLPRVDGPALRALDIPDLFTRIAKTDGR